jgi:hypothetical protein
MRQRISLIEGGIASSGAGFSSMDGGSWVVKDAQGVVRQVIGNQPDGTATTIDLNGPLPPAPEAPICTPVPGGFKVGYSGFFANGALRPDDLAWVEVHIDLDPLFEPTDATRDAALVGRGTVTFASDDYIPHTVRLVAVTTSRKRSSPSGAVTVTPAQLGPGDVAPNGIGTVNLDDGAVTPAKAGTGVTSNLVPDPGFNDAGWRAKRTTAAWGFVDASSMGFTLADWAAYAPATTTRAVLSATGTGGVPVIPGESYFLAYDIARSSTGAGRCWLEVTFRNSAGAELAQVVETSVDPRLAEAREISSLPTSSFETRDGQIIIPAQAATMHVAFVRHDLAGTSAGTLYLDRLELRSVISRSSTGARVETSPAGVLVFGANGESLGSITSDGSLKMDSGNFANGLEYKGTELQTWLDNQARGEVARFDLGVAASPHTSTEVEWIEIGFTALSGRTYKLRSSGLIARNEAGNAAYHAGIIGRWTLNGTRPLKTSTQFFFTDASWNNTLYVASDIGWSDGVDREVRILLTVRAWEASGAQGVYFDTADVGTGFSVWVEDVGPRKASTGGVVTGSQPVKRQYVENLNCTWSHSWQKANTLRTGRWATQGPPPSPMWQGFYDDIQGEQVGIFSFDLRGLRQRLQGATIEKVEIYLYAEHWYFNNGGNVWLGTSTAIDPPNNFPDTWTRRAMWALPKPGGRWVDLDVAGRAITATGLPLISNQTGIDIGNEIKAGTLGSFVLDPRPWPHNLVDYGRFIGAGGGDGSASPGLRITYSKMI